jgi:hypothetical protein
MKGLHMAHPLVSTDYGRWAEALDERLYQRTGLALIYWPKAPLASWWEEGLSADAAADKLLAQERPQPQALNPQGREQDPLVDTFDMQQERILWPWVDDPSCEDL